VASPIIELEKVSVRFGQVHLLEDVSLQLDPGRCLVLLGPSGEGKTTLLKVMAGLVEPHSGSLKLHGVDPKKTTRSERQNLFLEMGMLFQKNALFDSMTVLENVLFPMREVSDLSPNQQIILANDLLEAVELDHSKNLFPHEISGGMQKRLGVARALSLKPKIVLYDDPTAGLDPITSKKIAALIQDLSKKEGVSTVIITNDMMRAFQMADDIAFVYNKSVDWIGPPDIAKASKSEPFHSFLRGKSFA